MTASVLPRTAHGWVSLLSRRQSGIRSAAHLNKGRTRRHSAALDQLPGANGDAAAAADRPQMQRQSATALDGAVAHTDTAAQRLDQAPDAQSAAVGDAAAIETHSRSSCQGLTAVLLAGVSGSA
jgi:hypothetical protein